MRFCSSIVSREITDEKMSFPWIASSDRRTWFASPIVYRTRLQTIKTDNIESIGKDRKRKRESARARERECKRVLEAVLRATQELAEARTGEALVLVRRDRLSKDQRVVQVAYEHELPRARL